MKGKERELRGRESETPCEQEEKTLALPIVPYKSSHRVLRNYKQRCVCELWNLSPNKTSRLNDHSTADTHTLHYHPNKYINYRHSYNDEQFRRYTINAITQQKPRRIAFYVGYFLRTRPWKNLSNSIGITMFPPRRSMYVRLSDSFHAYYHKYPVILMQTCVAYVGSPVLC